MLPRNLESISNDNVQENIALVYYIYPPAKGMESNSKPGSMKHIYTALLALIISFSASAQLPDGSIAPDFTAEDLNGVEHNLYDLLDQGKKVIIDFSATWCGPCWNYHNTGALEEVWETYGPDGTDEAYVFFIEGDDTTTQEDLEGTGTATTGNWIEGTGYPIIDNGGSIFDDYDGAYYPTIYTICPNRMLVESGQISAADHASIMFANDCAAATQANDAAVLAYTGETISCSNSPSAVSASLMNLGTQPLTNATLELFINGNSVLSHNWSGNLDTYGIEDVQMGSHQFNGSTNFEIRVTSGDMNEANDFVAAAVEGASAATTLFYIYLQTDNWGEETGWEIADSDGSIVASAAPGSLTSETLYEEYVGVPSTGCYTFRMIDTYGDGLNASVWGNYEDGSCYVTTVNDDLSTYGYVYSYNGSYAFETETRAADVMTAVGVEEQAEQSSFNVYPNPVENVAWIDLNLAGNQEVRLDVVNLLGQRIMSQDMGTMSAGNSRMQLDLAGVESGIYLVTLTAGETTSTMRVTKK